MAIVSFDLKGTLRNVPKWAWIMVAGAILVAALGFSMSLVLDSWNDADNVESHDPDVAYPGNTGDPGTNAAGTNAPANASNKADDKWQN